MFRNYLKITFRTLVKAKGYAAINIMGLALGLACFIMIALYVADEWSYDRFNENADRIYRIHSDIRFGGTDLNMAVSPDPMGAALKNDYPQVEEFTRIYNSEGSKLFKKDNQFITEQRVAYADSTLFAVFSFPALAGDLKTALNNPNTVVINETTAKKYFGSTANAMGKTLDCNDNDGTPYKVTAVIKDLPHNAHFIFDLFLSMDNVNYDFGSYISHNFHTYLLLKPGADYRALEKQFPAYIDKYILPQVQQFMQIKSMKEFEQTGNKLVYSLMPLTAIHLHSSRGVELGVNGNIQYVYIFSAVAIFILLIACVNFMNLSTARSAGRAKEVGIRKVLGTEKKALIGQFLTETICMAFIALIISIALIALAMPLFNDMAGKQLSISSLTEPVYVAFILMLPIVVGTLAGLYPAFFLSSFKPIQVLKGKLSTGAGNSRLRSTLVVFQFATSIILIVGTIVIYYQLNYIQTTKIGFNKDQVLVVDNTAMGTNTAQAFKEEISKMSGVKASCFGGYLPVQNSSRSDNTWSTEAVMNEKNGFNMQNWRIDYSYIPTMGMEIIQGRNFSVDFGSDSLGIIINESAAKLLGTKNPVHQKLYTTDGDGAPVIYTIVGVVKNFNYESLRKNVGPLCFRLGNNRWASCYRISTSNVAGLIKSVEATFKKMSPGMPLNYHFLDESFNEMYEEEQRAGQVALTFSLLAVLIACLGLFGLAAYMAEQRNKEIGVRKVLGASVSNITTLLSKDFIKLVGIASLIAFPVAWWAMNKWLEDFAYRINISWWVFALAAFIALLIALVTVSSQAIKAALANPVKSLRAE